MPKKIACSASGCELVGHLLGEGPFAPDAETFVWFPILLALAIQYKDLRSRAYWCERPDFQPIRWFRLIGYIWTTTMVDQTGRRKQKIAPRQLLVSYYREILLVLQTGIFFIAQWDQDTVES